MAPQATERGGRCGVAGWLIIVFIGLLGASGSGRAGTVNLGLQVTHRVGDQHLSPDAIRYRTKSGEAYSITRLSYLLSEFALRTQEGSWMELTHQVLWMDPIHHRSVGRLTAVPEGDYEALRFSVGLTPEVDARDASLYEARHPLNPNLNGLHWSWQGGYVFLALEGLTSHGPGGMSGYAFHLAGAAFRNEILLETDLSLRHDSVVTLAFDLGRLMRSPVALSFKREGRATHSREGDPLAEALSRNLSQAFSFIQLQGGAVEAASVARAKPVYLPETWTAYGFRLRKGFPLPPLPSDNPLIQERVTLGAMLFQDPILSRDRTIACAACHKADHAFAEPRRTSLGVDAQQGRRNAMPLFNLAWKSHFFWDGRAGSLREQVLMPIEDPTEMDLSLEEAVRRLKQSDVYAEAFGKAFRGGVIEAETIALALENFLLTLTAYNAKFDRVQAGLAEFTPEEQRGFELFMTEYDPRSRQYGADCFHCHGGVLFTDHQFHNNGLPFHDSDTGREAVTGSPADRGKFMTPSLRNAALTAPYMHDGRFQTLEEVVAHYDHGIQSSESLDPNLAKHPEQGLRLSESDQQALIAFIHTLTEIGSSPSP